ncbi:flavin reductase [Dorea sp. D27]|uniref:flavin reductase n=1 Tax=Dorea sp. D27 TaxID=658665 RepID=UPI000673BAC1|nr:flavin reductase [Dorea sp. D27]KMZ55391.1 high molecular weight rubredoxin (Nitric oxide reductase NADH:FprAoxidoreductase) [Dorea sp. D27]
MNKNVFRNLSYGVYIISTLDGDRSTGCVANSIMQITSEPATIALSMNHDNFTNSCIAKSGLFAISILSETSASSLIGQFGFQCGKDVDKFEGISHTMKKGLPVIDDSCGYIVCKVIDTMETSTHTVFLGEVVDGDILGDSPAMTYAYYHNVVKGKSPKNAPTYLPEEAESSDGAWVCSICGYVYDGETPFEDLPDSYKCPVCGQGKDKFRRQ